MLDIILINGVLLTLITICLYTDIKERKIYNKITFTTILIAFVLNLYFLGLTGFWFTAQGLLLGLGLMLIPFMTGGMGAGDVKLLMAVGALKGPTFIFHATLATFLIGGIVALVILIRKKLLFNIFKKFYAKMVVLFLGRKFSLDNNDELTSNPSLSFPYGIAIFGGTLATLLVV